MHFWGFWWNQPCRKLPEVVHFVNRSNASGELYLFDPKERIAVVPGNGHPAMFQLAGLSSPCTFEESDLQTESSTPL
jgi:hypothetical protein